MFDPKLYDCDKAKLTNETHSWDTVMQFNETIKWLREAPEGPDMPHGFVVQTHPLPPENYSCFFLFFVGLFFLSISSESSHDGVKHQNLYKGSRRRACLEAES